MGIFRLFEEDQFRHSEEARERLERYLACDLLIVDDLGSEMTTSFDISSLYTLINTRLVSRRPTIISSNLTADELTGRYSEAVFLCPKR